MVKKKNFVVCAVFLSALVFMRCGHEEVQNYKDLEQNMMDLKLYQENLGDQIKRKNLDEASWLLEGADSILLVVSKKFKEHRNLQRPFSYYYKKEMREPIHEMRQAIKKNDTAKALNGYRILVKNCNSCHIDNDVDKEVRF